MSIYPPDPSEPRGEAEAQLFRALDAALDSYAKAEAAERLRDALAAKPVTLLDFLKAVKDGILCYAVALEYGQQATRLDDTGDSDEKRQLRIVARPAGFGGLVFVWQGTLAEILALDPFDPPTVVPNPPSEALLRGPYDLLPGAFCWGDAAEVERIAEKLAERRAHWDVRSVGDDMDDAIHIAAPWGTAGVTLCGQTNRLNVTTLEEAPHLRPSLGCWTCLQGRDWLARTVPSLGLTSEEPS